MGPYRTEDTDDDSCWSEESDDNIDSPQDRKAPANFEASQVEQPYVNTNIVRACNRPINLDPDYVGDWEDPDAFREFYQNWRDGIIAVNKLDPRDFKPIRKENRTSVTYTVHLPSDRGEGQGKLLGYILFNEKAGSVELTNFGASLSLSDLYMGKSDKRGQNDQAGHHGEGFKVGALVMLRAGYHVRISASSHYWNFSFVGNPDPQLSCTIRPPGPGVIEKLKAKATTTRHDLKGRVWEDVTFRIAKGKGEDGQKVSKGTFETWLKVSLELSGPGEAYIVRTIDGDLIIGGNTGGQIYLKGLALKHPRYGGKVFKYSYNFMNFEVNRDRQRLPDSSAKVGSTLVYIWSKSIQEHGDSMAQRYIDLYYSDENCADLSHAGVALYSDAAKIVRRQLMTSNPHCFLYGEQNASSADALDIARMIETNLGKKPVKIPKKLWEVLSKNRLLRTPQEELRILFARAEGVTTLDSPFATGMIRRLKAALWLNQDTRDIDVRVVRGVQSGISALFDEFCGVLRIHERWVEYQHVQKDVKELDRKESYVRQDVYQVPETSTNDRGWEDLLELMWVELLELVLDEIGRSLEFDKRSKCRLVRMARHRMGQMPRNVAASKNGYAQELEVNWTGIEHKSENQARYRIVLHRASTCGPKHDTELHNSTTNTEPQPEDSRAPCGCAQQIVDSKEGKATFCDLDSDDTYFPLIARAQASSFYGMAPPPAAPFSRSQARPRLQTQLAPPQAGNQRSSQARTSTKAKGSSGNSGNRVRARDSDDNGEAFVDHGATNVAGNENGPEEMIAELPVSEVAGTHRDIGGHGDFPKRRMVEAESVIEADAPGEDHATVQGGPARGEDEEARHADEEARLAKEEARLAKEAARRAKEEAGLADEKTWQIWHEEELPKKMVHLKLKGTADPREAPMTPGSAGHGQPFEFEQGEYARVRLREDPSREYVIFVHDIYGDGTDSGPEVPRLAVRRYSFLRSAISALVGNAEDLGESWRSRELVLHFRNVKKMGHEDDADLIDLDEIIEAKGLAVGASSTQVDIKHTLPSDPEDERSDVFFCRFATCDACKENSASLFPLADCMLENRDRWRIPKLHDPSDTLAMDNTPGVLGPLEGFSQAGCAVGGAIGFDRERHLTWKIRHNQTQVFDGRHKELLEDATVVSEMSKLGLDVPVISSVAGGNTCFKLNEQNDREPSIAKFLRPLDVFDMTPEFRNTCQWGAGFEVLFISPAVLHDSTIVRFLQTIFGVLRRRRCVHLKLSSLQEDHGLPLDRQILILVSSPLCAPFSWENFGPPHDASAPPTVEDIIGDLRGASSAANIFDGSGSLRDARPLIYNHKTGEGYPWEACVVNLNAKAVRFSASLPLLHPDGYDLLTVREIARLLGFPDDFAFYQSVPEQYRVVRNAVPPIVARRVGESILKMIKDAPLKRVAFLAEETAAKRRRLNIQSAGDL